MPVNVIMPVLGLTMQRGVVTRWLKREGERVEKDEPLLVIETDKAEVEVPAPTSGVLRQILAPEGSDVPVTHTIAVIADENEVGDAATRPPTSSGRAGSGDATAGDNGAGGSALQAPFEPAGPSEQAASVRAPRSSATAEEPGRVRATPLARKLAREFGLDLALVVGSGPEGRVQERDVRAAAERQDSSAQIPPGAPGIGPEPSLAASSARPERVEGRPLAASPDAIAASPRPPVGPSQTVPLSRVRAITAERMAQSARSVARVTLFAETDFSEAARFRKQLAPEFERRWAAKLSYDAMIAKACAIALAEFPDLNGAWVDGAVRRNPEINVGIAVQTDRGLLVPVLRNADRRPLHEVAKDAADLVQRTLAGSLRPDEMIGGTFTITNLGGFGVDAFTPIVNLPEAAILGIGRIAARATVVDGQLAPRETAWLSLSFDHRVADGVPAAQLLQRIKSTLESPYVLLT